MQIRTNKLREMFFGAGKARARKTRKPRQVVLHCDSLEERVTPAHGGIAHHAVAHLHAAAHHARASEHLSAATAVTASATSAASTATSATDSSSSSSSSNSSSSSSTLAAALATLKSDIQTIELASDTTVGQLAAIATAFETLKTDGLTPSSQSALESFENSLVTDYASGTTLTGNASLLSQFEAIYTSSPTTQETTDLTTAYDALAAAVTSSNISAADITLINTDWSAVLAAQGSTSAATFPYFQLVTGQALHGSGLGGEGGGGGSC
jgi:peptidoglycan DL-endopeptidase CwlO